MENGDRKKGDGRRSERGRGVGVMGGVVRGGGGRDR